MDRAHLSLGGAEKDRSIAIWIQTESQYFDLRIRRDRPRYPRHAALAEYDSDALRELAHQAGDTGICTIEDDVATWSSWADRFGFCCSDVSMFPDDGRLEPKGRTIWEYETIGSPVRYEEAWVRQPYDHGLIANLTLRDVQERDRLLGVLVVTGRYAGFVERSTTENASTLEAQLEALNGDRGRMVEVLDCEASYAIRSRVGEPYFIRHSNLPFREGRELDVPAMDRRTLDGHSWLPARGEGTVWHVESWFVKR